MRFVLAAASAAVLAWPQQQPLRTTTHGVRITAYVTASGKAVEGLGPEDFEVRDEGVPQQVDAAAWAGHVSVGLLVDTSLSIRAPDFAATLKAADQVVASLAPEDRAALITFSDRVVGLVPPTIDRTALRRGLDALPHLGAGAVPRSTVWDGVMAAAGVIAEDSGQPLVVLISDGMDNASWLQKKAVAETLDRAGVSVDLIKAPWDPGSDDQFGPGLQDPETLAHDTDGRVYSATDRNLGKKLAERLSQLRESYVLTYVPHGVKAGDGWHDVTVRVRGRRVSVHTRGGYNAGTGKQELASEGSPNCDEACASQCSSTWTDDVWRSNNCQFDEQTQEWETGEMACYCTHAG